MAPNQNRDVRRKRQMHDVGEHLYVAPRFNIDPASLQIAGSLPKRSQGCLRRKQQRCAGFGIYPISLLQPKKERAMSRVTVASRTGGILNRITHFDVVEESVSAPAATGTFNPGAEQSITHVHVLTTPDHMCQQAGRADEAKIICVLTIPRQNHRWLVTGKITEKVAPADRCAERAAPAGDRSLGCGYLPYQLPSRQKRSCLWTFPSW